MKKPIRIVTGTFGGKTKDFIDSKDENGVVTQTWKQERAFEQKHLKAYLQGREYFRHGFIKDETNGRTQPQWHVVKRVNPEKITTIGA